MDSNMFAGRPDGAEAGGGVPAAIRLRQFSSSHCSVFGAESMLRSSAYYAYNASVAAGEGVLSVTPTSSSVPGEYRVRVLQIAPRSDTEPDGEAQDASRSTVVTINGERLEFSSSEYLYKGLLLFFTGPSPEGADTVISVSRSLDASVRMIRRFTEELFAIIALLRSDGEARHAELADAMERAFFARHGATALAAADCGISPKAGGIPEFDEARLRASLEERTEDVASLFSRSGEGDGAGIVRRIKELIGDYLWSVEGEDTAEKLELYGHMLNEMHSVSRLLDKQSDLLSGLFEF